ncbi:transmembrane protein [Cystoisospora suis]|uniref:Transmembrane protein n=1 Tax=Cystoisospora suis TaxID=483139 RepID=A0A2C6K905_9APIC|nr:transmembrane protein [Cystoisospora suis]
MYPTYSAGEDPTRVPGPNGGSYESTSTLWLWQHRELQRRGEYDKVILFFPHFHASKLQSVWRRYQRRRKRKQLWRQEIEKRRRERKTKTLKEEEEDDEEEEDEDDEEGQHLGGVDSYDDAEEKKKRKAKERRSLHALPKREDQEGFLKSRLGEERYTASTTTTGEKNPFSVSSFSSSSAFSSSSPALLDVREPPLKQGIREYASWIASQLRLVLKLLLSSSSRHQHSARKDMMDVKKKKNSSIGSSASLTDSSSLGRTPGNSSSPPNQENEEGMQEEKAYRHFSETSINKNDKEQEEQQEEEEAPPPPQLYRKQNTPAAAKDPRRRLSKEEEEMDDEDDEEGMVFFERRDLEDLRESCVHYDLHLQGWGTGGLGIRAMLSLGLLFWSNREVSFTEILQLHQLLQKYSTSSSSSSSPSSQRHPSRREERRKSSLGDEERREDTTMKKKKNTKSGRLSTSDIRRLIKKKRKKEEEEEREAEGEDEEGEKAAGEALAQKDGERQGGGEEDEEEEDKMTKKKNTIRGRREWIRSTGRQHPKQPSLHEEERRKKKSSIQNSRPLLEEKLSYHVREEKVKEDQDGNDFFLVSSSSSSSLKTVTLKTVSLIRTPHAGYGSRSDENVGLEKLGWTKWALSLVPERFYRSVGNTFYRKELLHLDSDRVLCTLAQEEKQSYSLVKKEGSLISLFHTTLYYSFLDEDYDIPVLSQIGISEGRLPMSESADILRQNPPAQNRFFYIDTNQTGLNRIDIISSPRFYPLFVDRRACTAVSLSGVYTFTLKILEVRNSRQKPSSFQPIRYLALKGEDAYDEKISLNSWKYLLFQRKRDKFERQAANRFMYIHEAVRMMQGKEAQRLSFDNDHHPTISSAWFYSQ